MKLVGYTDRMSVPPGESIAFMVSSELPNYRADIVQLIHGDPNPRGPGFKACAVKSAISREYTGKLQRLFPGSYIRIPFSGRDMHGSFTVHMWIRATIPERPIQTLISSIGLDGSGFAVRLVHGRLSVQLGRDSTAVLECPVRRGVWYSVGVVHDATRGRVRLSLDAIELTATRLSAVETLPLHGNATTSGEILIGAESVIESGVRRPGNFYNGKIDAPRIYARALAESELSALRKDESIRLGLLAAWDFSRDISSTQITDISGNGRHGRTVNRPTRAVCGRAWNGSELMWKNAPEQYAAIHFHEDDLDDAGWETTQVWTVPDGTASGIYALHIHGEGEEDYLPFAVRPPRGKATANIAFLMPTFSYLAYGNHHMSERPEYPDTPNDKYIVANKLNSLYDIHTDGSGCCYASWLRPIVSMRPGYASEVAGIRTPSQLDSDLYLVDWLTRFAYSFDVIADENLHTEGRALLDPYKVVLTGCHPEYWSDQMIRACRSYLHDGGRMMYLGGNGMYWVAQLDPESGHTVEMRRPQPSSPHFFDPLPGELHLSTTGERGALWRNRGLPSHEWLGVVMSGAGRTGQHYERRPDSFDERVAWIFRDIGSSELVGNFPGLYCGYGAAGGEVDRVNFALEGTPHHTMVLASTAPFDNTWLWDPVDRPNIPRGDLALVEYPKGGAVFSASSIAWCGCLSHNEYINNVSHLTRNVLDGFLSLPLPMSGSARPEAVELELLKHEERAHVLSGFGATAVDHSGNSLIHQLFEAQVERTPDEVAVGCEGQCLTYGELNRRANQLAHCLRERGIGPDRLVAICMERGIRMLVGVLGVLKAGGAYVPMNPSYPTQMLEYMLKDALPPVLLTQDRLIGRVPPGLARVICLDGQWAEIERYADCNPDSRSVGVTERHLAYVIYTSGSTGAPKGAMIEHRNVVSLWHALERVIYAERPGCQRVSINAPFSFDSSVKQIVQLLSGRTLVVIPDGIRTSAAEMLCFIENNRVECLDCTPTLLGYLVEAGMLHADRYLPRIVLVGGEAISQALWNIVGACTEVAFYNLYGPTECTVDATVALMRNSPRQPVIGRPIENTQIYLLDSHGQPVPTGAVGEIYIGGAGVGRGYLNRPELTAERFVPNTWSPDSRSRVYRSGDLGRWRSDGNIEYLGRNDDQVKVRGFRVELQEVEAQLLRNTAVRQAVVIARESATGEKHLVAYVVMNRPQPLPSKPRCVEEAEAGRQQAVAQLREFLGARMPQHMVPAVFVLLDKFPLTVNGKLDRRALPLPVVEKHSGQREPQRGSIEHTLTTIWQEVLQVDYVGRQDSFLEIGGHSLLATQVLARVREQLQVELDMRDLFNAATVEKLTEIIERKTVVGNIS